jgi:class 3 adenylate cyclase/transcriptional regulator with GAF, ATPase, and Fis domain
MSPKENGHKDNKAPFEAESSQETLRNVHHLRTLYDVSKELFGTTDAEAVLRNFLLLTMGNFGVPSGFILTQEDTSRNVRHFVSIGFQDTDHQLLKKEAQEILQDMITSNGLKESKAYLNPETFHVDMACIVPFIVDGECSALLGLGPKLTNQPFTQDDLDVLSTLINNVVVALNNANAFQDIRRLNEDLEKKSNQLDRRVFHLKTLYDVSKDIFGIVESETVLKNFLFMTLGNFGVMEGFILTLDSSMAEISHFIPVGLDDHNLTAMQEQLKEYLLKNDSQYLSESHRQIVNVPDLPPSISLAMTFSVDESYGGLLGLGSKMTGDDYDENDRELLGTLLNNLVIALKNVRSFEEIKDLNEDLQTKNVLLEKTLAELQAALKKVEILESVKSNLSKFVPATVSKIIEKSPTAAIPDAKEQDVSVLFVDIEGYTKISEKLQSAELNEMIERYFSLFMDAIYENGGDVNETAGDGLMVLFLDEDKKANALHAVSTALNIREKAMLINQEKNHFSEALVVNMGINSGQALVGAAKFESYTGSRWTYTARGTVTNIAARIGAAASEGAIFISKTTADRVSEHFSLSPRGKFKLKNVSNEIEVFSV